VGDTSALYECKQWTDDAQPWAYQYKDNVNSDVNHMQFTIQQASIIRRLIGDRFWIYDLAY